MAYTLQAFRTQDGQITQTIYGYIRDQKFTSAIASLQQHLQVQIVRPQRSRHPTRVSAVAVCLTHVLSQFKPDSRAALSLLAYCLYHSGQFEQAAST